MAATTTPRRSAAPPAPAGGIGVGGVLRSELTKIRSVRSTYWTLVVLLAVEVGLAAVIGWAVASRWTRIPPADRLTFDPTATSLGGHFLGQLIIAVLGVIVLTSEYSTGMIRTSLTAVPRRVMLYTAKAAVFAVVALVVGVIASVGAFLVGQQMMTSTHASVTLSQPRVLPAVLGSGLYLAVCGLFAYGIGAILRHTAGAITAAIGLLFVPPIIVGFLPTSWQIEILRWLPSSAGTAISATTTQPHMFPAWGEFGVFCGYTAVLLVGGLVSFVKRDA